MILGERDIRSIINNCKFQIESAYQHQLEENFGGDEYFKRGFLLATREITEMLVETLKKYRISINEIE